MMVSPHLMAQADEGSHVAVIGGDGEPVPARAGVLSDCEAVDSVPWYGYLHTLQVGIKLW